MVYEMRTAWELYARIISHWWQAERCSSFPAVYRSPTAKEGKRCLIQVGSRVRQRRRVTGAAALTTPANGMGALQDVLMLDYNAMRNCTACPLSETRKKVVVPEGDLSSASVLLVGEGPGEWEDRTGRPFIGKSGKKLDWLLDIAGLERSDIVIANTVLCRPTTPNGKNRKPKAAELKACRPHLDALLAEMEPTAILTLGDTATKAVAKVKAPIKQHHGRRIEGSDPLVIPMYHPAATMYSPGLTPTVIQDWKRLRHEVSRDPTETVAHSVVDIHRAKEILRQAKVFALDFETSWVVDRVGDVTIVGWSFAVPHEDRAFFCWDDIEGIREFLEDPMVSARCATTHNSSGRCSNLRASTS